MQIGFKIGLVSRGVVATPTSVSPPPHSAIPLSPYSNFFYILSGVSKLIKTQSEFFYDPLLESWLLFNLVESYTFSEILMNVVQKLNMKK